MQFRPAAALTVLIWLCGFPAAASAEDPARPSEDSPAFAVYVMNKIDDQYRGDRSHGWMTMEVKTKNWARSMEMESWTLGTDYSLVRILNPKKEKGTATLKAENDLFTYLSKTGRTIKITSGMMGGSWMGSHFTNDDLIKHTRLAKDYTIALSDKGEELGVSFYRFTLTPKPDSPVVWGKTVITVRRSDLQPLSQDYYDEDGKKVRRLEFSDHRKQGDRVMPMKMEMIPLDKPGEYTRILWKEIDFGAKIDKSFFSLEKLRSL